MPGVDTVKLFCPNCGDIYTPPSSKYAGIDGACFGTTFCPLFFQTYPELLSCPFFPLESTPTSASGRLSPSPSPGPVGGEVLINPNPHGGQKAALGKVYVPRIYGFKVSERARSGPRMKWLRERPERAEDLDLVDHKGRWKDEKRNNLAIHDEANEAVLEKSRGKLFDDEDEAEDDEEEEEEEDAAMAGVTAPPPPPKTGNYAPASQSPRAAGRR